MGGTVPPRPGSSPLTRGKPPDGSRATANRRLIPAHAGKTAAPPPPISTRTAHPRSRGENAIPCISSCTICGSSPLTRGKLEAHSEWRAAPGLIPAHAGKTHHDHPSGASGAAHPRSRGENYLSSPARHLKQGSSPLTRGKLRLIREDDNIAGLIPAHAGKTPCGLSSRISRPAHPRSRGENFSVPFRLSEEAGSSPLTRGKRAIHVIAGPTMRLIPAHAGKTCRSASAPGRTAAHPRSRGENSHAHSNSKVAPGSSPLTRGKLFVACFGAKRGRLIPAHAGKTAPCPPKAWSSMAHPRSRGENSTSKR